MFRFGKIPPTSKNQFIVSMSLSMLNHNNFQGHVELYSFDNLLLLRNTHLLSTFKIILKCFSYRFNEINSRNCSVIMHHVAFSGTLTSSLHRFLG